MAGIPFRGLPESTQKYPPAGIKTQRKYGPVDPQRVRIAQERFGLAGIAQVAREKLGRFQDKTAIHVYGIARIHEGQVTARTVIVEKAATMRVLRHPGGSIHGNALVGDHVFIVCGQRLCPKAEQAGYDDDRDCLGDSGSKKTWNVECGM